MNQNHQNSETMLPATLNARQIEILQKEGLPTDPAGLNAGQFKSIEEIETMLQYLELKYGEEFEYLGYSNGSVENKWLTAAPVSGSSSLDIVTVKITDTGEYSDDYPWIFLRSAYSEHLADAFRSFCGTEDVRVFTSVGGTSLTDITDTSLEALSSTCHGSSMIFVCGCDEAALREAGEQFAQWCVSHGFYGLDQILSVSSKEKITWLSRFNYKDLIPEAETILYCSISADGSYAIE